MVSLINLGSQVINLYTGWNYFCVLVNEVRPLDEIFGHYGWFNSLWHWNPERQEWESLGPGDPLVRGESYVVNYNYETPTTIELINSECQTLWWFDNDHRYCQQGEFCGLYMYEGLQTFATQQECEAALGGGKSVLPLVALGGCVLLGAVMLVKK